MAQKPQAIFSTALGVAFVAAFSLGAGTLPSLAQESGKADESSKKAKAEKAAPQSKAELKVIPEDENAKVDAKAVKLSPLMQAARAAQANRERRGEQTPTFTTEDLRKRFGGATGGGVYTNEPDPVAPDGVGDSSAAPATGTPATGAPATGAPEEDPTFGLQQQRGEAAVRAKKRAEAEATVARLNAQIQELEKRSLAISNPYLPRPKLDEDDPAKEEWDKSTAAERRDQTQKQLEQLRRQLADAEKALRESGG